MEPLRVHLTRASPFETSHRPGLYLQDDTFGFGFDTTLGSGATPQGEWGMSALTVACASRLLRRAAGLRSPIEHARANPVARALGLSPSGGEVQFSSTSGHEGEGDGCSECARKRPGDDGLPIVYHPAYSKPVMPEGHRFPMSVFREIYRRLLRDGVAVPGKNLFQPARMPSLEELTAVHDEEILVAVLEAGCWSRPDTIAAEASPELIATIRDFIDA